MYNISCLNFKEKSENFNFITKIHDDKPSYLHKKLHKKNKKKLPNIYEKYFPAEDEILNLQSLYLCNLQGNSSVQSNSPVLEVILKIACM